MMIEKFKVTNENTAFVNTPNIFHEATYLCERY